MPHETQICKIAKKKHQTRKNTCTVCAMTIITGDATGNDNSNNILFTSSNPKEHLCQLQVTVGFTYNNCMLPLSWISKTPPAESVDSWWSVGHSCQFVLLKCFWHGDYFSVRFYCLKVLVHVLTLVIHSVNCFYSCTQLIVICYT